MSPTTTNQAKGITSPKKLKLNKETVRDLAMPNRSEREVKAGNSKASVEYATHVYKC